MDEHFWGLCRVVILRDHNLLKYNTYMLVTDLTEIPIEGYGARIANLCQESEQPGARQAIKPYR